MARGWVEAAGTVPAIWSGSACCSWSEEAGTGRVRGEWLAPVAGIRTAASFRGLASAIAANGGTLDLRRRSADGPDGDFRLPEALQLTSIDEAGEPRQPETDLREVDAKQ